jgi:hypothetical protein
MVKITDWEVMSFTDTKKKGIEVSSALVTNVGQAAGGIVASLLTAEAGRTLDTLPSYVLEYLQKNSGMASLFRSMSLQDAMGMMESELYTDYQNIVTLMKAGIGQGVGGIHAGLYELLSGTSSLLQSYRGIIQRVAIDPYIDRWAKAAFQPNRPDAETAWFMRQIGMIDNPLYWACFNQDGWHSEWMPALEQVWTRAPPIDSLLDFKRRGYVDANYVKAWLKRYRLADDVMDKINLLAVQYPDPYRLADFRAKNIIGNDEYISTMATFGIEYGYSVDWAAAMLQFPTFDQCMIMYRRGLISLDDFHFYMNRQNMGDYQVNQLLGLKDVIPPINDLIRFAVREAYGDHSSEVQYPTMVDIAQKQGLTPEMSALYWYSHWDRIPVNFMFANYHRGLWDKEKLLRMLKIVDIHPDDREDITNVAYSPPTVRELGYGFDVGAYSTEDIVKYRRWGGLSPEDAQKSGQAMILYRTESERNQIRSASLQMYKLGKYTREEFEAAIKEITPNPEAVRLWLIHGDLEVELGKKAGFDVEGRIVSSSEALAAFKLKLRDEDWTRAALKALDWTQDRIDVAILHAKTDMAETEQKASEVKYKKLTLTQIKDLFNLQLITKEQMTTEITLIGYTPDDAELLTEIYTRPAAPKVTEKNYTITDAVRLYHYQIFEEEDIYENYREEGYDDVHAGLLTLKTRLDLDYPILTALYEKGYMNLEDFAKELIKMGMSEVDAGELAKRTQYEFQVSRLATEKELTKAEILKGAKNNVLTIVQASSLLQDLGYDANEAMYILAINKVVVASDPEGYWDMRRVTENYKKARGEPYLTIPDEVIMLEKEIKELKAKLAGMNKPPLDEVAIADLTLKIGTLESRLKQLLISNKLA